MMGNGDDGVLVFKGRMDHLVKLRGQRIELDEVASSILRNHSIDNCPDLKDSNGDGDSDFLEYLLQQVIEVILEDEIL